MDQRLPADQLANAARTARAINAARGMLQMIPALKEIPVIPPIPPTLPELHRFLAAEIAARPTEEIEHLLTMIHLATGAWLTEYQDSIQDSIADPMAPATEPDDTHSAPDTEQRTDDASSPRTE